MDYYTEELEMRLRFAEEDALERESFAYEQGRRDAIDELLEKFKSYICTDEKQTYFYTEFICEMQKIAEQMKGEGK